MARAVRSSRIPNARARVPYGSLIPRPIAWKREGGPMTDVLMVVLTIVFFALSFALIRGFERV